MRKSREEKKVEAIARMKAWKIFGQTVRDFESSDTVSISEPPFGACYWLNEEQKERVRKFEEEHNALVYHAVRSFTDFGEMETYLYVSDYPDEWPSDREDILDQEPLAYVENLNMPDCSEIGRVGIRLTPAAGLMRTW